MKLIIKVCGMTQATNIREVESLGVDWMGFIFHPRSPRYVGERPGYLPRKAKRVGVFVNDSLEHIRQRREEFGLHLIQLHGDEPPAFCREVQALGVGVIKAIPVAGPCDLEATLSYEGSCDYLLFDTKTQQRGGSGIPFDWQLLQAYQGRTPFLLSGGIGPDSLQALRHLQHPQWAGIDLNSRFESTPGLKEPSLLNNFLNELKNLII